MRRRLLLAIGLLGVALCVSCSRSRSEPIVAERIGVHARASGPSSELNRTSAIGSNLAGVVDYSTDMPFVDLFKSSRPWISGSDEKWDDGRPLDLDEYGWVRSLKPGQVARTLMLTKGGHPGGEFIVVYDGEGEIAHANELLQNQSRPGRQVIRVKKDGAVRFAISKTSPGNPIRNIRVFPPGGSCEEDDARWCDRSHPCPSGRCLAFEKTYPDRIFHPKFLQSTSHYSVLRFMDWMRTNDSTIRTWADRPKVTHATWNRRGVPVEVMMSLATRLRAEPWVNIPHLADDDYIRRFATLVRDTLPEEFRVWLEYSNEIWNSQFDQHEEVARCPEGKSEKGEFGAALVCQAERSDAIFKTWHQVFGGSASRVVRVVASQAANAWTSKKILMQGDLYQRVDALAIAPYFGVAVNRKDRAEYAEMSLDELLQRTEAELIPKAAKRMQEQAEMAARFGLTLVAYEGGQHFSAAAGVENDEKINTLFDGINRHPRMSDLYLRYLTAWREAGGKLFVHYNNCGAYMKWGRWGLREYVDEPRTEAPKLDGVMRFIEQNPRWW